jgi:hypothetical protein
MERVIDVLEQNMGTIELLVKITKMPLSIINDYQMYVFFKSIDFEKRQMKKYAIVAEKFKVSQRTVIRAINEMNKKITA